MLGQSFVMRRERKTNKKDGWTGKRTRANAITQQKNE